MAYTVQLSQFEGSLDLLLHLIARARIDIRDIFVSQITEQYLAYMEQVGELDMDAASEFLQMAAALLEIKSRALLPKPPKLEEGEVDPEEELIRRLEEYKQYKEASARLQEMEKNALKMLYRLPDEMNTGERVELTGMTIEELVAAFSSILRRSMSAAEPEPVSYIQREIYTVQECMFRIQHRLGRGKAFFEELFEERPTREEVVTVFMALLELWKLGQIMVSQTGTFGQIEVARREG